ncbi:hypothetical protein ACN9MB_09145 [Dyella kyungheensis]|uniref:hypothetical protein n=1 Tax=Dyella kyungheensis TaxID=1242174 RepID=UPI003CF7E116
MKPQCAKAVADFLGREPTKGELDGIEMRLQSSMKELRAQDPNAWSNLSRDERIAAGAKLARQKTVADTTRAHANTLRDIEIKQNQLDKLESFKAGTGKGKGQLAALRQRAIYHAQQIGGDTSVEIDRKAIFNDLTRQLDYKTGGKGKFWGMVQDPTEQQQLMRAIWGEKTGSPDVDASAKAIRDLNEQAFQRANDAGININRLENYHVPQPWAWEKVGADRAGFVKDAMAEIDPTQYTNVDGSPMTRDQIQKMVEKSAETLGTNGSNKRGEKQGTGQSGTVGGSRNAPRQLHFSSADGYMRMMDKYGSADSVYSMLDHHLNSMARDIAAAKKFGRDADNFFPQLVEKAFANDALAASGKTPEAKAKALLQLEKLKAATLKEWQAFRSPDHPGTMPLWAKISQNIRGVASATLLGSSTISAIPDLQMAVGYAHLRGMARTKVLANVLEGLKPTTENRQRIARLGIVADTLHHSVNRMGTEDLGSKAVRFMNQAVHNISGLRAWDRGMTHGVAASMMDMFGDHVSKTEYADLAPTDKAYMDRFGITADHWNAWKQAELDKGPNGNHSMLTPDGIYGIDDAKLRPLAEQRLSTMDGAFKEEAAKRDERTQQEIDWVNNRAAKLGELKQRAKDTIDAMKARASVKGGREQGIVDARAEQLRASVSRAEVETDIGRYLSAEGTQVRARDFLEAVEEGASVERQVIKQRVHPDNRSDAVVENFSSTPPVGEKMNALIQRYGASVGAKAEELGQRQARTEARIAAAQKSVDANAKERSEAIDEKTKDFAKRIDARLDELNDFSKQMRENAQKRRDLNDAFEQRFQQEMAREIRNLKSDAAEKLLSATLSETHIGARGGSGSSIADQVALGLDPGAKGTLKHEIASWLFLLKQTPLGIFKTHMLDVPNGLQDWKAAWLYRAKFMAGSAALGAVAQELKDVVLGQDPENLMTPKGLAKIMLASGGLGMYGDFALGDKGDHQNGALAKLLGPGATMAEDAINLFQNAKGVATNSLGVEAEPGEQTVRPDQLAAQAVRFARSYAVPFSRVWYLKAAFNHLVYDQIMNNLSPGYSARVQNRMAQKNQSSWWQSGELTPSRAPDVGAALGQPAN